MKKIILFTVLLFFFGMLNAQSSAAEAKAAYLLAEEQFSAGKFVDCISYLEEASKILGAANSKILYLKIMSQRELAKTDDVYIPQLLGTIETFEKAPDVANFNEEKYLEVMKLKLFLKKEGVVEKEVEDPTTASFRKYTIDGFNTGMSIEQLKKSKPEYFARVFPSVSNGIEAYLPQAGTGAINLTAKGGIVFVVQKMLFDYFTEDASFSKGTSAINNFKSSLRFQIEPVETTDRYEDKGYLTVTTNYQWKLGNRTVRLSFTKTTTKKSFSSYGFVFITDDGIAAAKPETLTKMAKAAAVSENVSPEEEKKRKEKNNQDIIDANTLKIGANKNDHLAYYNRGLAKMNLKDYAGAIDDFNQAISLNKKTAVYYKHRAWAKHFSKDYAAALEDYAKAVELNSSDIESYQYYALLKEQTGDFAGAVQAYNRLIELGPKDTSANKHDYYYARGVDKYRLKDFDGAYADLTKHIQLDDRPLPSYYWRGKILLLHRGNKTEAAKDFEKLTQEPNINVQQAMSYFFLDNKEKALKMFDYMMKQKPNDPTLYYSRAGLYSLDKNKTAALADFKLALEKGLKDFNRMGTDENIDFIKEEPEFKALIQQYKK